MTRRRPSCKHTNKRPSGAKAIAVAAPDMPNPHCDSVKPAGNVAALSEKNPLPNKSHAATLVQRQTQRRDKFQECDRPLFSTDPDFENVTDIVPIMKSFPPSYSSFVNSQQAARQKFRHARAKIDALSAARNVPRQENGPTRTAHRPRPSCRGPGRCK